MVNYKKIIKVSLIGIISIIISGIIAVTLLITLVNPNRFKPMIIAAVNESTGRQLALNGDISWTVYPYLGLKIQQLSLSNPAGFKTTNFFEINSANVSVALIPLLEHKIIFKNLAIDGLKLALIKQNGINNWTFNTANKPQNNSNNSNESGGIKVEFSSLSLTNTSITYADMDLKKHQELKNINLNIDTGFGGAIKLDTMNDILDLKKVSFSYNDEVVGKINLHAEYLNNPTYNGNISMSKLMLNQLLHDLNLSSDKNIPLLNNLSFKSAIAGDKQNLNLKNFTFNFSDALKGSTNIAIRNFANPNFSGNVNLPSFSLNKLLTQMNISPIEIPNKSLFNQVTFKSAFVASNSNLNLSNLYLKTVGSTLTGNISISSFKPLALAENIMIDQLEVSDFSYINGFKAPLHQVHLDGYSSFSGGGLGGINGRQSIQIANITLLGFNLDQQIRYMDSIITNHNSNASLAVQIGNAITINSQTINKMRTELATATASGPKNLNLKTNLGSFNSAAVFHEGIVNPSSFKLNGPSLRVSGNGTLNLKRKTLFYKTNTQILVAGVNPIFTKLILPATIGGTFASPGASLDWNTIIQEVIAYSVVKNKNEISKVISGQLHNAVGKTDSTGNKVIDDLSKAATNAISNIFGGSK